MMTLNTDIFRTLRVSLTSKCNLHCIYCFKEGITNDRTGLLKVSDITKTAKYSKTFGARKVKLTGGEPLLYPKICSLVKSLKKLGLKVCITTNGVYLDKYFNKLVENGVDEIVVSLDTLNHETFKKMTCGNEDTFLKVLNNLIMAGQNFHNVWINVVITPLNFNEIPAIIDFCVKNKINAKFLQLFKLDGVNFSELFVDINKVRRILNERGTFLETVNDGTRDIYKVGDQTFHCITLYCNIDACYDCLYHYRSIVLTPDGALKPCLKDIYEEKIARFDKKSVLKAINNLCTYVNAVRPKQVFNSEKSIFV